MRVAYNFLKDAWVLDVLEELQKKAKRISKLSKTVPNDSIEWTVGLKKNKAYQNVSHYEHKHIEHWHQDGLDQVVGDL